MHYRARGGDVDKISDNFGNYKQVDIERVEEEAAHLAEMVKTLERAIEAKQMMMEPKLKRPKVDGRIRILKVCILA